MADLWSQVIPEENFCQLKNLIPCALLPYWIHNCENILMAAR